MRIKLILLVVLAALFVVSVAFADPPSWSNFVQGSFQDIYLSNPLATGTLDYTLYMGTAPKVNLDGNWYDVEWIQAFFVISQDQNTGFNITEGSGVTDWKWESKANPGSIAGWINNADPRIYPMDNPNNKPSSKDFHFAQFDITGNAVLTGLHVQYTTGGTSTTKWVKASVVPEPSSLAVLLPGLLCPITLIRRWRSSK